MECKWDSLWSEKSQEDELIDTLWNVNLDDNADDFEYFVELIDTLWNVN